MKILGFDSRLKIYRNRLYLYDLTEEYLNNYENYVK